MSNTFDGGPKAVLSATHFDSNGACVVEGWVLYLIGIPAGLVAALRVHGRTARIAIFALVAWCFVATGMLCFPVVIDPLARAAHARTFAGIGINPVPLRTLRELVGRPDHYQAYRQILENLCVLLPVGLLLPMLVFSLRKWRAMLFLAVVLGVGVESLQFLLDATGWVFRTVDVDDALLNAVGIMVGFALWRVFALVSGPLPQGVPVEHAHRAGCHEIESE